jgi:hypothetical protein
VVGGHGRIIRTRPCPASFAGWPKAGRNDRGSSAYGWRRRVRPSGLHVVRGRPGSPAAKLPVGAALFLACGALTIVPVDRDDISRASTSQRNFRSWSRRCRRTTTAELAKLEEMQMNSTNTPGFNAEYSLYIGRRQYQGIQILREASDLTPMQVTAQRQMTFSTAYCDCSCVQWAQEEPRCYCECRNTPS